MLDVAHSDQNDSSSMNAGMSYVTEEFVRAVMTERSSVVILNYLFISKRILDSCNVLT